MVFREKNCVFELKDAANNYNIGYLNRLGKKAFLNIKKLSHSFLTGSLCELLEVFLIVFSRLMFFVETFLGNFNIKKITQMCLNMDQSNLSFCSQNFSVQLK